MNVLFKFLLGSLIVVGIFTAFGAIFPQVWADSVNSAVIYFLGFINNLNGWVHVSTVFAIMRTWMAYIIGIAIYYMIKMWYHMIT